MISLVLRCCVALSCTGNSSVGNSNTPRQLPHGTPKLRQHGYAFCEQRLARVEARHATNLAAAKAAEDRLKVKHQGEIRMMMIAQHEVQVEHGLQLAAASTAENRVRGQLHRERLEKAEQLADCKAAQNRTRMFYMVQLDAEQTASGELKVQLKAADSRCQQDSDRIEQLEAVVSQVKGDAAVANREYQATLDSALCEVEELQAVVAMQTTADQVRI